MLIPLTARAQQPRKPYRIGILSPEAPPPGLLESFQEGLREIGYIPGQNISFEVRNAEGDIQRLATLAEELVALRVDVILAVNTPAVQAARSATDSIPVVMTRVANPLKTGLVASLSRPGGNVTGLSFFPDELSAKRLHLVKEILPSVSRVAVLWWANPGTAVVVDAMEAPSRQLGMELLRVPVNGPDELSRAFAMTDSGRAEAMVVVDDALITQHRSEIMELATRRALPVFALFRPFAESGALMTYGPSAPALYRRAAHYVAEILNGVRPTELPVEQPTKFELVLNLKTAKTLGVTFPLALQAQADEVIE